MMQIKISSHYAWTIDNLLPSEMCTYESGP